MAVSSSASGRFRLDPSSETIPTQLHARNLDVWHPAPLHVCPRMKQARGVPRMNSPNTVPHVALQAAFTNTHELPVPTKACWCEWKDRRVVRIGWGMGADDGGFAIPRKHEDSFTSLLRDLLYPPNSPEGTQPHPFTKTDAKLKKRGLTDWYEMVEGRGELNSQLTMVGGVTSTQPSPVVRPSPS